MKHSTALPIPFPLSIIKTSQVASFQQSQTNPTVTRGKMAKLTNQAFPSQNLTLPSGLNNLNNKRAPTPSFADESPKKAKAEAASLS